jgi:hypothetical protein
MEHLSHEDEEWEREWNKHHRAHRLQFTFRISKSTIKGDNMTFSMLSNQSVSVIGKPVTALLDANGNPISSGATLSNQVYTSSDPTLGTVAPDPAVPGGAIITGVPLTPGAPSVTFTLLETATATEPDGTTTEKIQGVATIVLTSAPPPPPPVAASIAFTFGVPK